MIKTILGTCVISVLAVTITLVAQSTPQTTNFGPALVNLPVLTYLLDSPHTLRPIIGVPGAASIASPIDAGVEISEILVPPSRDYILAITKTSAWPLLLRVQGDRLAPESIGALLDVPHKNWIDREPLDDSVTIDRATISPGGSAAAFFDGSERIVYSFSNLPQAPALVGRYQVEGAEQLTALAISDDAKTLAFAVSDSDGSTVFLASQPRESRLIGRLQHATAITFFHKSDSAVVGDDADNKVYSLTNGQLIEMASQDQGISRPSAIAMSNDNQHIYVANKDAGTISVIEASRNVSSALRCNCVLSGLYPTSTDAVFRLTDFSGGPISLLDAGSGTARIVFVPLKSPAY
jgi:DNA-binding beta-propeller fold protein YncE